VPYPSSLSTVTVSDTILDLGVPAAGTIRFVSTVWLNSTADATSLAAVDTTVTLDATGSFSVVLPANDDPDWLPQDWTYLVVATINGKRVQGSLALPASPSAVNLFDALVLEAPPSSGGGSSGPVAWSAITGKPLTFPPSAHSHAQADVAGLVTALAAKADATAVTTALAGKAATVHTHAESDVTGLTTDLAGLDSRLDALEAGGGGGGTAATFARGIITTGSLTMAADAAFTPVPGLSFPIAAVAGDDVELSVTGLMDRGSGSDNYYELVVLVGGAAVRYASTGTSSPAGALEGDPGIYVGSPGQRFAPVHNWSFSLAVQAGDLSGGNVTFGIAHKGNTAGKIFAEAAYPLRWRIRNDH
jgi:hypothetical protein